MGAQSFWITPRIRLAKGALLRLMLGCALILPVALPARCEPLTADNGEATWLLDWTAPRGSLAVAQRDAVAWTLHYPVLFSSHALTSTPWTNAARAFEHGRLLEALIDLDNVPEKERTAAYHVYRAHFMLLAGRPEEARRDLNTALAQNPKLADAWALKAVMDLRQGDTRSAWLHAQRAVALNRRSVPAYLALSYAQQALKRPEAALVSVKRILALEPENPLALVRLAELDMARNRPTAALDAAKHAVHLAPGLADAQTALGFAYLGLDKPALAAQRFAKAKKLSGVDPTPRLGLGLALIRQGETASGCEALEDAVVLAPKNALLHTYLGRAYDQEGRKRKAAEQYALARRADPLDPTPYYFEALQQAAGNAPVSALSGIQAALDRYGNRAVYRTRSLLATDHALYLADAAALDSVLGLDDEARLAADEAVSDSYTLGAAHLAAGDALATLSRSGLARQSEYLQAALREPLGALPPPLLLAEGIQPGAVVPQQGFFRAALPDRTSFNDYAAVFNRRGFGADVETTAGSQDSWGDQIQLAGASGSLGGSLSQLHFKTDGFGPYNNLDNSIWRGILQIDPGPDTRLHIEYKDFEGTRGGVTFPVDASAWPQAIDEYRHRPQIALLHRFDDADEVILLASREEVDQAITNLPTPGNFLASPQYNHLNDVNHEEEIQFLHSSGDLRLIAGGVVSRDSQHYLYGPGDFGSYGMTPVSTIDSGVRTRSTYVYSRYRLRPDLHLVAGLGYDDQVLESSVTPDYHQHVLSPKLGLRWRALPDGELRLAVFRGVDRFVLSGATLEPTQVAGFGQYYNDGPGARADRAGLGWTQRMANGWTWGLELSGRELRPPVPDKSERWYERDSRAWVSRALSNADLARFLPGWQGAISLTYDGQGYTRSGLLTGLEQIREYRPQHLRLSGRLFDGNGWGLDLGLTWVRATGRQETTFTFPQVEVPIRDNFVVADAAVNYKLSGRTGELSLGVMNLGDTHFNYLEMDPSSPRFAPERYLYAKLHMAF